MRKPKVRTAEIEGDAAALYVGNVMHARLKPVGHRFSYRVMSLLIDLDRLKVADRQTPLFGVNRRALYSFHEVDHGARDGSSLRQYAQRRAAEQGIDLTGGQVLLLCYPRLFGYTFNPLSVYFCYRASGQLALIIYEVRNTFGDIHAYVLPVKGEDMSPAGIRQTQEKRFSFRHSSRSRCAITSGWWRRERASNCAFSRPTAGGHSFLQPSMDIGVISLPKSCCAASFCCRPSR